MLDSDDENDTSQRDPGFQADDEGDTNHLIHILFIQSQQMSQIMMKAIILVTEMIISAAQKAQRIPYHMSILTGQMWVLELINGHPDRIRNELGVRKHVFKQLVDELSSHEYHHSKHITLEDQLSIFLYTCVTGLSCRHVGERFQRSNDTISKYFCKTLVAFSSPGIYIKYIKLPRSNDPTPSCIADDPAVFPFFKDAIGTIDGTHIASTPSAAEREATHNRKSFHSQNCLVCCNFDLEFIYVLGGWEGSMADASVYHDARTTNSTILIGKYYLADAGYPICPQLLVPYRGIRYHSLRPQNAHEYFNLRHAQLRNVVERIIGVLKRRFRILVIPRAPNTIWIFRHVFHLLFVASTTLSATTIPRSSSCKTLRWKSAAEAPTAGADQLLLYGDVAGGFTTADERDTMATKRRDEIAESLAGPS